MPGGNQMGPLGQGPRTGRAAGFCAGYDVPGYANAPGGPPGRGGGFGWGGGRGRGGGGGGRGRRRWWFRATGLTGWQRAAMAWPWGRFFRRWFEGGAGPGVASQSEELTWLKQQQQSLETELAELKQQIAALEAPAEAEPAK